MALSPLYPAHDPVIVQLAADVAAGDGRIPLTDTSGFPPPPAVASLGSGAGAEVFLYHGIEEDALTGCERGLYGTAARGRLAGTFVDHGLTARHWNAALQHLAALATGKADAGALSQMEAGHTLLRAEVAALTQTAEHLNAGKANTAALEVLAQDTAAALAEVQAALSTKAGSGELARLEEAVAVLQAMLSGLGEDGGEGLAAGDVLRLEAAIALLGEHLAAKASVSEVAALAQTLTAALASKAEGADLEGLAAALAGKAEAFEVQALASSLAGKADLAVMNTALAGKAPAGAVEELAALLADKAARAEVARLEGELAGKAPEAALQAVSALLAGKADAAELMRLDDSLGGLSAAMEGKADSAMAERLELALADKAGYDELELLDAAHESEMAVLAAQVRQPRFATHDIALAPENWAGGDGVFRHPLAVAAADGDIADFCASLPVLMRLSDAGILVQIENDGGVLTAAASAKPDFSFAAQIRLHKAVAV